MVALRSDYFFLGRFSVESVIPQAVGLTALYIATKPQIKPKLIIAMSIVSRRPHVIHAPG